MSQVISQQVVVTSGGVKLVAAVPYGQQVLIANRDATNSLYVGPQGVSTTSGAEVKPNSLLAQGWLELPPETELYAVSAVAQTPRSDVTQVIGS